MLTSRDCVAGHRWPVYSAVGERDHCIGQHCGLYSEDTIFKRSEMALIKCKECGKQISSKADSCPNCGRKRPKSTSGFTWAVVIFLAIGVYSAISASNKKDEQQAAEAQANAARLAALTPEQRAAEIKHTADMAAMKARVDTANAEASSARYACKEFVKRSLNDPDAAQFDSAGEYFTQKQGDGKYRVEVTVRAKNGFNALRHIAVNCVTQKSGERWLPVSVKEITT